MIGMTKPHFWPVEDQGQSDAEQKCRQQGGPGGKIGDVPLLGINDAYSCQREQNAPEIHVDNACDNDTCQNNRGNYVKHAYAHK